MLSAVNPPRFFTNISTIEWGVYTSKICKPPAGGLHGGFTADNIAGPYGIPCSITVSGIQSKH